MAISVKNISPEKLTSLLDWFSRNADEIYQNGTPGAKNVLDNALMKQVSASPFSSRGFQGVLGDSIDSVEYNPAYFATTNVNTIQALMDSIKNARRVARPAPFTLEHTKDFLSDSIPNASYFDRIYVDVPLETPVPSSSLVFSDPGIYSRMRPHKNTALGKWFDLQLAEKSANDFPW